jgi:hypothetical protein
MWNIMASVSLEINDRDAQKCIDSFKKNFFVVKKMNSSPNSYPEFKILPLIQPTEDDTVPIDLIREMTAEGLNGTPSEDRAMAWLVLLRIFPEHCREWRDKKREMVENYRGYTESFEIADWHTKSIPNSVISKELFKLPDNSLMDIIHKDIIRTAKHIFMLPPAPLDEEEDDGTSLFIYTIHLRRLERILYVLGTLNKTISYMQGFNELVMPFYTVMYSAKSLFNNDEFEVEAIVFNCIFQLLAQTNVIELFMTMNQSEILLARLSLFTDVLDRHLPDVSARLKELDITPLLYAFKWFSLLFCQNHEMPVIHEIWDALLSHFDRLVDYAFYIGAAKMKVVESSLLNQNFTETLYVLQNIEVYDIYTVLRIAHEWWEQDHKQSIFTNMKNSFHNMKNKFKSSMK